MPAVMRCAVKLAIPAIACLLAAPAFAVELSGAIRSSTGTLPASIEVFGDRADKQPVITGKAGNGRYRITLPDTGMFRLRLQAAGWDAAPKVIFDPKTAGALDFLIYPAKVPEPALAAELIEMGEKDQAIRGNLKPGPIDKDLMARMEKEDLVREQRLGAIIDAKGWPTISMVGHEAANQAWLIAQHASPAFLKRCVPLMQAAADKGEMAPGSLALSIDRDLTNDGNKQRYGSQVQTNEDGKTVMLPIEDPEHLDARRASMGMQPFASYKAMLLRE
jgi:hypothetical protein